MKNQWKNELSDYGSGNVSDSSSISWGGQDIKWRPFQTDLPFSESFSQPKEKSASFSDLIKGRCTLEDVMQEFQTNGSDSPYTPEDEHSWSHRAEFAGLGPSSTYLRQKSWPEPDRTPAFRLPTFTKWPLEDSAPIIDTTPSPLPSNDVITEEQLRVLSSLPNSVLYSLLRELEQGRGYIPARSQRFPEECRFCKNNGERESYYRLHSLKDATGRVQCPVLRAYVCPRCGAHGDTAHTAKYCPRASAAERLKSSAVMRSVRLASGRRRAASPPLRPLWAALEQRLLQ